MALSEFYESTIVKVEASFGFSMFECLPDEISAGIGLQPDATLVKGTPRLLRGGKTSLAPFNSWAIGSRSTSKDINEHLRELLDRLAAARRPFDPKWGEPAFGVLWKGNYLFAGSGPFYEPDVVAGIATLGAALYQDIYQVDQEDEWPADESGLSRIPKTFFFPE